MRLIDAEKMRLYLLECHFAKSKWTAQRLSQAVEHVATVDAEPVVRCRECRWFASGDGVVKIYCMNPGGPVVTDFDGFCHHGKQDKEEPNEAD